MNSDTKQRVLSLIEQLENKIQKYVEKGYFDSSMDWKENPLCSAILIKKCCQTILDSDSSNNETVRILLVGFESKAFASIRRNSDEENNMPPNDIIHYISEALKLIPKKLGLFNTSKLRINLEKFVNEVNQINTIYDVKKIRENEVILQTSPPS